MIFCVISVFSIAAFGLSVGELILPVNICKQSSVDYSACLTRAAQKSWPRFVEGLPEFNFPPLDPLFLADVKVKFNKDNIYGEIVVSNVTIVGLKKNRFLDIRPHFLDDTFRLEVYVRVPQIIVDGDCNAEGTLGGFRMMGKGRFNATIDVLTGPWDITGQVVNDTWILEHVRVLPSIEKMKISFKDLFGGSTEINDVIVTFVNEYWPAIYRAMLPIMAEGWDPLLTSLCNRIFSKISFSKLFQAN